MRLRPAPGKKIRHPVTFALYEESDVIEGVDPLNLFWARLIDQGDVVVVDEEEPGA